MKNLDGLGSTIGLSIALHVQGNSALDVLLGPHSIDGFLHFSMTPVTALHCIGSGRQERIIQECQRFLQVGGVEFL